MEFLGWSVLEPHLKIGHPCLLEIGGSRGMSIGFAPANGQLFARVPITDATDIPTANFAELDLNVIQIGSESVLQISTRSHEVFREFYSFVLLFAEELETSGEAVPRAFLTAMQRWRQLASRKSALTIDQQLGLFGELSFLHALLVRDGPDALDAWIAQDRSIAQRHDFRIADLDLEIKTTRAIKRRHYIHGIHQLAPSEGRRLFVVSIRVEPAGVGAGISLSEYVDRIDGKLIHHGRARQTFHEKLSSCSYDSLESSQYTERLLLADAPRLIPVDDDCPRIIPASIHSLLPPHLSARIDQVTYAVDFDGLGFEQGSPDFIAILGPVTLGDQ